MEFFLVKSSSLLRDIANEIFERRNSLVFKSEGASLLAQKMVEKLLILFYSEEALDHQQTISLLGLLRAQGINTLKILGRGTLLENHSLFPKLEPLGKPDMAT